VLFTYVGRLVPIKRIDLMLRGAARARRRGVSVRLAVVGDGVLRQQLERLADELGGYVRFLGYRSDLPEIAAGTDAAVLTSDSEGTPVWLIEAAAAARPAVATAVGGVPEVVTDDSGVLVSQGDEIAVSDAIARLSADPTLRRTMGDRARAYVVDRYSSSRMLAEVDVLYQNLLRQQGHRHGPLTKSASHRPSA
jgi:glycosyltransferase involved in cell wall biosynthesis